jgi:pyruvate-formate lyase
MRLTESADITAGEHEDLNVDRLDNTQFAELSVFLSKKREKIKVDYKNWEGFIPGEWRKNVNVRDFIQKNYTPYSGGADFLAGPTQRTESVLKELSGLFDAEKKAGGVLSVDTRAASSLLSYGPGYLD